jgi:hypothetical protein
LRSSDPKRRLKALKEIKTLLIKELISVTKARAQELSEPITLLMRQVLSDPDSEVYQEALRLIKSVISGLAPHLTSLDLHILIGSFVGIIVSNTVSTNMRMQMASDKVIIYFAKHNNIGPFVIAKDILKNIEKIVQALVVSGKPEMMTEKK